jgi:hypothetical protein
MDLGFSYGAFKLSTVSGSKACFFSLACFADWVPNVSRFKSHLFSTAVAAEGEKSYGVMYCSARSSFRQATKILFS